MQAHEKVNRNFYWKSRRQKTDSIKEKYPHIDIILDDGSHIMSHEKHFQKCTTLLTTMVYMVEDTHTCYWDEFEGGAGKAGTFMEVSKPSSLNAVHTERYSGVTIHKVNTFNLLYDSSIRKSPQGSRQAPITKSISLSRMNIQRLFTRQQLDKYKTIWSGKRLCPSTHCS